MRFIQQIWKILTSTKTSMLFLLAMILCIGTATFIEDRYDTATARLMIYNSWWFELLLISLAILYVLKLINNRLFSFRKLPQLIFHIAFIIIIMGAGITRYFGYNAHMHIRENESEATVYSADPHLQIQSESVDLNYVSPTPLLMSQLQDNAFQLEFEVPDKLLISFKDYVHNYEEDLNAAPKSFAYGEPETEHKVNALLLTLAHKGQVQEVVLSYDRNKYIQPIEEVEIGGLKLKINYGPKPIPLPFSLALTDFNLEKYPGSDMPSSSESNIVLKDDRKGLKEHHRITKTKVLDYDGYRFFQTSYDDDEQGTILSVNYDYFGTRITYIGYLTLLIGVLFLLFSKNSNFFKLDSKIREVRTKRKTLKLVCLFILTSVNFSNAQSSGSVPTIEHADRFGHLITQTIHGRFSSVHSLATDVVHKISGMDHFSTPEKGKMNAMQIFLDMHLNRDYWMNQKIIVVRNKSVADYLDISGKYASFNDLYEKGNYKLEQLGRLAFQKEAINQTAMDKEIIKVSERVNIFLGAINGNLLKLFPVPDSTNNEWVSWDEQPAFKPIVGTSALVNKELILEEFNYSNILRSYFIETLYAGNSGDYNRSNQIIGYIDQIQQEYAPNRDFPTKKQVDLEVFYNKSDIFGSLKNVYGLLGIILLIFVLIENFRSKQSKPVGVIIKSCLILFGLAFLYHTFGLALRWYLSGHAPWSNGYEVLLFVSWGGVLASFFVINYSKITLAATGLLAFVLLMVSEHSYYDPQLTNLQPVLKSFWLIIHVAIITIGYSFLAISFLLGLINIIIGLLASKRNMDISELLIEELTYINEKLLTLGMFLTAIGSFIGGIWANESWGRYWAWDAKETWSLIIVLTYGIILHLKYIPRLKSFLAFNISSVLSFGTVIMTFVGVNYYFKTGLHSYATDDPPIFPTWIWVAIISLLILIIAAIIKDRYKSSFQIKSY